MCELLHDVLSFICMYSPPSERVNECHGTKRSGKWTRRPERVVRTGACAGGAAEGADVVVGGGEFDDDCAARCAGFRRSREMVCLCPFTKTMKNLVSRLRTSKGPSYRGCSDLCKASFRMKT